MVEPLFTINGVPTPASGFSIQTVYAQCLGPVETWLPDPSLSQPSHADASPDYALRSVIQAGYNMIHFAPVQELGISGSAYCIKDQLQLNPSVFGTGTADERFQKLETATRRLRDEFGVLSMVDIVLNHTATNTDWIKDHPEATFNLLNSPHLKLAYEIDCALSNLSACITAQNFSTYPLHLPPPLTFSTQAAVASGAAAPPQMPLTHAALPPADIRSEGDLSTLHHFLKTECLCLCFSVVNVHHHALTFSHSLTLSLSNTLSSMGILCPRCRRCHRGTHTRAQSSLLCTHIHPHCLSSFSL